MKEYHIGIDCGTSNSCVGIYKNGMVQIIPNKLGERTTPSVVCFTDKNKVLVGEETISQKMDEFNKIIYEVKRFVGLNYQDFIEMGYDKNLNYEVVNKDGLPKIRININGNESFYSAEDITSLILQKMVKSAEDFIEQTGKAVKINKAIITVPAHFTEQQKEAMRRAAKSAGIEIPRIINEPTAAALAYGIGKDLVPGKNVKVERKVTLYSSVYKTDDIDDAPPVFSGKSKENSIVFDLGGGTLDITLLSITKNSEDNINFEILGTDGDIHLGGSDFDNKLIDYCIKEYCKQTGDKEENVRQNKRSCKRLKIKCENAKKLLSISNETIINVENFIGSNDLFVNITRELFDELCSDLYDRIEEVINELLNDEVGIAQSEIDNIILVGGATRIIGVRNLLYRLFDKRKVKDNLNPDEAVAYGATLESAKMEEKDRINFNLQDISAYKLGIAIKNSDPKDKEGELMYSIIKKFSKIPVSNEKKLKINLTKEFPNITIKIYEGNEKYVNKNTFLGEMKIDNLNKLGTIEYLVKFDVDVNGQLTVTITIDSLGIKEQEIINKVTHALLDTEKKK
jgi:molecular chaperone DnaK (HSP70)